jgi:hypothetical protein
VDISPITGKILQEVNQKRLEHVDTKYKEEATAYYKEQRELIADQKHYSKTTFWSTIATGTATIVMAIFMALQYFIMANDNETKHEAQLKLKQQSQLIDSLTERIRQLSEFPPRVSKENQKAKK